VLITRPEPGATETAHRIAARGLVPVVAPVMKIRTLAATLPDPGGIQAALVTSSNALAALPQDYHATRLLAVGDATADRARAAGQTNVHSAKGDATDLANLAQRLCAPDAGPLLLLSGQDQGAELAETLRQAGFAVIHRVVYAAQPVASLPEAARAALAANRLDAALFFSADTARAFIRLVDHAQLREAVRPVEALAISPAVRTVLSPLPWRRVRVALRPNQDELLALLP
jgi:uroporphyrinogen-III synthase